MDRTELSSAIRQEMQVLVGEALEAVAPEMLTANLATLEQRVQQVGRVILGGLIERVATAQAPGLPRPARHTPSQTHARSTSAAPAPLRLAWIIHENIYRNGLAAYGGFRRPQSPLWVPKSVREPIQRPKRMNTQLDVAELIRQKCS